MIWLRYIPNILAAGALAGGIGYVWALKRSNALLASENAALTLELTGCEARAANVAEDKESDDEIDNIPDDGLRSVPDRWLLP